MKALFSVPFFALGLSSGLIAEQPVLDQVVSGDVLLTSQPNGLLIEQTSQEAWLDWQQFSIAEQQVVQFLLANEKGLTVNRVTGNEVSSIFGQLQSNGTVYLINPNGILFSESAQVDVGGLFVSDHWLDESLGLTPSPGSHGITVFGQIHSREQLTLLANELTQAGSLQAGNIQLLGNASALLQLDNKGTVSVAVPATGGDTWIENSGVMVANDQIYIGSADTNAWLNNLAEENNVSVSGDISAPRIDVYGSTIEVIDAQLQAELMRIESQSQTLIDNAELSAPNGEIKIRGEEIQIFNNSSIDVGSGKLTVGGELQGKGADRNAEFVFVSQSVDLIANAGEQGDGGEIIVWSDGHTEFHGRIEAKGGELSGDGGFAEVSGKETLTFRGDADLTAAYGRTGTLLLDPTIITIANGAGASDDIDGVVNIGDYAGTGITIYEETLEGLAAGTDILLQASQSIIIEDLADNELTLDQTGQVTFEVINTAGQGSFIMQGPDDAIVMSGGGNLTIDVEGVVQVETGGQNTVFIDVSDIEFTNGGNLTITASPNAASITSDELIISVGDIVMNNAGDILIQANNVLSNQVGSTQVSIGAIDVSTGVGPNSFIIDAVSQNTNVQSLAGDASVEINGILEVVGLNLNSLAIKASTSSAIASALIELNSNVLVETNSSAQGSIFLQATENSVSSGQIVTKNLVSPGGNIILGGELVLSGDTLISAKLQDDNYAGFLNLAGLQLVDGAMNNLTLEYGNVSDKILSKYTNLSQLTLSTSSSFSLGTDDALLNFSQASLNALPATVNTLNFSSANDIDVTNLTNIGFNLGLTADSDNSNTGSITLAGLSFTGSQALTTNGNLNISESLLLTNNDFIIESGAVTIANGATDLTIDADLNFTNASGIGLTGNAGTTVTLINRGDTGGDLVLQNVTSTNAVDLVVHNRFNLTDVNAVDLSGGDLTLWAFGGVELSDATVNNLIIDIDRDNNGSSLIDLDGTNAVHNVSLSGSSSNDSVQWDGIWTISGDLTTSNLQNFQLQNTGFSAQSVDLTGVEQLTITNANAVLTSTVGDAAFSQIDSGTFDLSINTESNLSIDSAEFTSGNLSLIAGGTLSVTDANTGTGNLSLTATGASALTNGSGNVLTLNNSTTLAGNIDYSSIVGNGGLELNDASLSLNAFDSADYTGIALNGASNSITTTVGDLVLISPTVNNSGNLALTSAGDVVVSNLDVGSGTITVSGDNLLTDVVVNGDWAYDRLIVDNANSFTNQASLQGDRLTSVTVGADITLADGSSINSDRVILNAGGNIAVTGVSSSSPNIPSISISAGGNITDGGNSQGDIGAYWIYGLELAAEGSIADSLAINYQVGTIAEDQLPVSDESSTVINSSSESKNPVQSSQASIGNLPRNNVDLYVPECNAVNRDCRKNNAIRKFLGALLIGGALPE